MWELQDDKTRLTDTLGVKTRTEYRNFSTQSRDALENTKGLIADNKQTIAAGKQVIQKLESEKKVIIEASHRKDEELTSLRQKVETLQQVIAKSSDKSRVEELERKVQKETKMEELYALQKENGELVTETTRKRIELARIHSDLKNAQQKLAQMNSAAQAISLEVTNLRCERKETEKSASPEPCQNPTDNYPSLPKGQVCVVGDEGNHPFMPCERKESDDSPSREPCQNPPENYACQNPTNSKRHEEVGFPLAFSSLAWIPMHFIGRKERGIQASPNHFHSFASDDEGMAFVEASSP